MQDDLPLKLVCSMPSAVIHTCGAHTVIQHRASNWYGQMNPTVFRTENHICYLFSYLFGFLFTQNFPKCRIRSLRLIGLCPNPEFNASKVFQGEWYFHTALRRRCSVLSDEGVQRYRRIHPFSMNSAIVSLNNSWISTMLHITFLKQFSDLYPPRFFLRAPVPSFSHS